MFICKFTQLNKEGVKVHTISIKKSKETVHKKKGEYFIALDSQL